MCVDREHSEYYIMCVSHFLPESREVGTALILKNSIGKIMGSVLLVIALLLTTRCMENHFA